MFSYVLLYGTLNTFYILTHLHFSKIHDGIYQTHHTYKNTTFQFLKEALSFSFALGVQNVSHGFVKLPIFQYGYQPTLTRKKKKMNYKTDNGK